MSVSCCYNVIIHAAMMTEQCCNNIVIIAKQHCWQRYSCCMASSTLSISCWPAQLCPYHVGRHNFVHIMLANLRRWELMLYVRQAKEITCISRFLVIINWNKLITIRVKWLCCFWRWRPNYIYNKYVLRASFLFDQVYNWVTFSNIIYWHI